MSMEMYEKKFRMYQMYNDLRISEKQIKEGNTKDALESLATVRERYGL